MSAELVRAARAEEQRLLRELESTPLFRRLEAVRALLAEYGASSMPTAKEGANAASVAPARSRAPSTRRAGSLTTQVITATADYLREQQRRAQSLEILQALRARGIEVTGRNPKAVAASILSNSDLFNNVRGEGYGLAEWGSGLPLLDPRQTAEDDGSGSETGGDADRELNRASGLDSDSRFVSNGSWATSDRPRPNPDHI
jgi:hypothetical protein